MEKIINKVNILLGGEAGNGVMSAGKQLMKSMVLGGLNVFTGAEYPSLIRGGHNVFTIRVSAQEIFCQKKDLDIILALNKETIEKHSHRLSEWGGIIYDGDKINIKELNLKHHIKFYNVPLQKITQELKVNKIMENTIIMGATFAVLNFDLNLLEKIIIKDFKKRKKSEQVIHENLKSARAGYDYIKQNYLNRFHINLKSLKHKKKLCIDGNTCLTLGAIKAGCKFLSAYPMTPATSIMQYFVKQEKTADIVMKQAFDEITAINMALGASFAGVRAMTSTSGGGLALMTETISLVGISEIPLVIVDVQRPGPATGLPTRQGQGDLKFVLNIAHGDFPRIVLAPGDMNELFYHTFNAFNLADKYQLPVLILSDKYLASTNRSIPIFSTKGMKISRGQLLTDKKAASIKSYQRFKDTPSGISPRAIPGQKAIFTSSSDEHNPYGQIYEDEKNRIKIEDKRFRKLDAAIKEIPKPKIYGPKNADITILSWGSPKGAILEAIENLKQKNIKVNFMQFLYIFRYG